MILVAIVDDSEHLVSWRRMPVEILKGWLEERSRYCILLHFQCFAFYSWTVYSTALTVHVCIANNYVLNTASWHHAVHSTVHTHQAHHHNRHAAGFHRPTRFSRLVNDFSWGPGALVQSCHTPGDLLGGDCNLQLNPGHSEWVITKSRRLVNPSQPACVLARPP